MSEFLGPLLKQSDLPRLEGAGETHPFRFKNVANFVNNSATVTGALVITTNVTNPSTMMQVHIKGYQYVGAQSSDPIIDLVVNTYSNTSFTNAFAISQAPGSSPSPVTVGKDASGRVYFVLGTVSTVWRYAKMWVEEVLLSHSGATQAQGLGWTMDVVTTLPTFAQSTGLTPFMPTDHVEFSSAITGLHTTLGGKAASSHSHGVADLPTITVAKGGTGRTTLTSGRYLRGAGTSAVGLMTPAQVLADIGADLAGTARPPISHSHMAAEVDGANARVVSSLPSGGVEGELVQVTGLTTGSGPQPVLHIRWNGAWWQLATATGTATAEYVAGIANALALHTHPYAPTSHTHTLAQISDLSSGGTVDRLAANLRYDSTAPNAFPDGISLQNTTLTSRGFPGTGVGVLETVATSTSNVGQRFYDSAGVVWSRTSLSTSAWGSWSPNQTPVSERRRTTNLTVANNSFVTVPFTSTITANFLANTMTVTNDTVTILRSGVYAITVGVRWSAGSGSHRQILVTRNGASYLRTQQEMSANAFSMNVSGTRHLNAGDVIEVTVYQNSGASVAIQGGDETFRTIALLA